MQNDRQNSNPRKIWTQHQEIACLIQVQTTIVYAETGTSDRPVRMVLTCYSCTNLWSHFNRIIHQNRNWPHREWSENHTPISHVLICSLIRNSVDSKEFYSTGLFRVKRDPPVCWNCGCSSSCLWSTSLMTGTSTRSGAVTRFASTTTVTSPPENTKGQSGCSEP